LKQAERNERTLSAHKRENEENFRNVELDNMPSSSSSSAAVMNVSKGKDSSCRGHINHVPYVVDNEEDDDDDDEEER
jgi:hypothetical protein